MEFIAAKCPNCGGDLQLPDDKIQVKCMYCSFDIIIQRTVNTTEEEEIENWLKLAVESENSNDFAKAYKYYTKVLKSDPENYVAHIGKGLVAGYLSKPGNFRLDEIIDGVKAGIRNAPYEEEETLKIEIAKKIDAICSKNMAEAVIPPLELAHEYDPTNEEVITKLYSANLERYLIFKDSDNHFCKGWDEDFRKKAKECLLKLQQINPEKAASLRKANKIDEPNTQSKNPVGSGCLIIVINTILLVTLIISFL